MKSVILLILLSATVKAYDEKVSCIIFNDEIHGETCRLENVNLQTKIDTKSLKYVHFHDSKIEYFTQEFVEQLEGVESLNVNSVGLEHIDGNVFGRLNGVYSFYGSENELESLVAYAFGGITTLEVIYLAFNKIKFIHEDAFKGLQNLYVLDLSSNRLKIIPDGVFDELYFLTNLDLSSNKIENVYDEVFKDLYNLRSLAMSKNNFKSINSKAFDPLINLKHLDLCFNKSPIDVIDNSFLKYNVNLSNILLCSNKIKAIDRKFFANEKKDLDIVLLRGSRCTNEDLLIKRSKSLEEEFLKLKLCFDNYKD